MRSLHVAAALYLLGIGCLGWLLVWLRGRRPDHYGPPLARGFLRGGRFRGSLRDDIRSALFRLGARATAAQDEEVALLMDTAAHALFRGQGPRLQAMIAAGRYDRLPAPQDLREADRRELERRARMDKASTDEAPAFRQGVLVGYLRGVERDCVGAVISFNSGARFQKYKTWETAATDAMLAGIPAHAFRRVLAALLALGWLLAPSVRAADFPTYPAAQLSQYQHKALALKPGELVCAFGFVESVRPEKDGDYHVWLCSDPALGHWTMTQRRGSCVLGEIVPSLPLLLPGRGLYVKMCGRWVEGDLEHGWSELHPLRGWCSPAGSCEVKP